MNHYFLVFIVFFNLTIFSQKNGNYVEFDTLTYLEKTNGSLDSIDNQIHSSRMVFPLMTDMINGSFLNPFSLLLPAGNIFHVPVQQMNKLQFSALPHIGVAYAFGSQGAQHLQFNYHQVFRKDVVVNLSLTNNASTGFYRNSNWKSSSYSLGIAKNSNFYSFLFKAGFSAENRNLSNGIIADSLASLYSLTLIPVKKEDAFSNSSFRNVLLVNSFNLNNKDSSRFVGLVVENRLRSLDRYYHESGQLSVLYPLIQYDSITTSDHYGLVDLRNQVCFELKSRKVLVHSGISANYWRYSNAGLLRDTLELDLVSTIELKLRNWEIKNFILFNLYGAKNAWSSISTAVWRNKNHYLSIENSNNASLPQPFQRFNQANNSSYSLTDINLQKSYSLKGLFGETLGKHYLALSYNWQATRQVYVFNGQTWLNNVALSQLVLHQIGVNGKFNFGSISVLPNYLFTIMDKEYRFFPMQMLSARTIVKGGIFKAKKLKAIAAIDLFLSSSYKAPSLTPFLTMIDFSNLPNVAFQKPMLNAGALLGFEVETFRFFARLDNIAYFISKRSQLFLEGYTIPTWQIKFGLTWDFWN